MSSELELPPLCGREDDACHSTNTSTALAGRTVPSDERVQAGTCQCLPGAGLSPSGLEVHLRRGDILDEKCCRILQRLL
jgi:hypothetical protein